MTKETQALRARRGREAVVKGQSRNGHRMKGATHAAEVLEPAVGIEAAFDSAFATELALREKQIQQNYRPIIGIHKWFARRPGTIFRSLLLAEFAPGPLQQSYWKGHALSGLVGDPFMGGGTPIFEANRLGFDVVGCDINPMAHWIVRQSLAALNVEEFSATAELVISDVESQLRELYETACTTCRKPAPVKYFLWVKIAECPTCAEPNDLFPSYRLAEAVRHPKHVLACRYCGELNECAEVPTQERPIRCRECGGNVHIEGSVSRKKQDCRSCGESFSIASFDRPPRHRMWAMEYRCAGCYRDTPGRQFKRPDANDLARYAKAQRKLSRTRSSLPIPNDIIPAGDESDRLHRWGYSRYREMFNDRQLLGLGLLLQRIQDVESVPVRHALLTVFSDTLRYQNMLCRYDTYALKCQDIFSVHGFPVGFVQCENNLLGIPRIGSGAFRHFVEKYVRAKNYCRRPFETKRKGKKRQVIHIDGETIEAELVGHIPKGKRTRKQAYLVNAPSQIISLRANLLDGVFTDPPYFDNVQYAELIDFCFAWLRQAGAKEHPGFSGETTRSDAELTGNDTLGRDLEHFSQGISTVFRHFAKALKPGAPFVFTYHHNDPLAYLPLVVAILDAGLDCTATLPAAAEMSASLHIARTGSSVLDSVFVCRKPVGKPRNNSRQVEFPFDAARECVESLKNDAAVMGQAGLEITGGDLRCLLAGHVARLAIGALRDAWSPRASLASRMANARQCLEVIADSVDSPTTVAAVLSESRSIRNAQPPLLENASLIESPDRLGRNSDCDRAGSLH